MVKRRKSNVAPISDQCPITVCMGFIGGAWVPGIIWHLSGAPRRFSELKSDLGTVSPKVLADQLKKLESLGILIREVIPSSPPTVEYSLTSVGREFKPIIEALVQVGKKLKSQAKKPSVPRTSRDRV